MALALLFVVGLQGGLALAGVVGLVGLLGMARGGGGGSVVRAVLIAFFMGTLVTMGGVALMFS